MAVNCVSGRAGAFQFVELTSDSVLPLPYQIQIIKKNYGIICWRYPQPRKMCKIHIYPVPMAVSNMFIAKVGFIFELNSVCILPRILFNFPFLFICR